MREAEAAGCQVMNGELMLLHQGAAAFRLWTGEDAPLDLMREALEAAIAGRATSGEAAIIELASSGAPGDVTAGVAGGGG